MHQFKVADMRCGHCVAAIEQAVKAVDAQAVVTANLDTGEITVESRAEAAHIQAAIREAGYDSQPLSG